ncbi:MAG: F0F1 ATP synthase subunit B [Phycisphaerales bacterium]|nr:F0F1 ATP synthase subunit B [Phycisphaerales bacterium]
MITTLLNTIAAATFAEPEPMGGHTAGTHIEPAGVLPTVAQGIVPAVVSLVVFVTVLLLLSKFVWPKIAGALHERADKIKNEIEAAESARMTAKAALEEYQSSLAQARAEAQKMIAEAKAQQQVQFAELRVKADAELTAMKAKAVGEIDAAKKAALAEVYSQTATLATAVAGKILQREVNSADQGRFVSEALAGMKN